MQNSKTNVQLALASWYEWVPVDYWGFHWIKGKLLTAPPWVVVRISWEVLSENILTHVKVLNKCNIFLLRIMIKRPNSSMLRSKYLVLALQGKKYGSNWNKNLNSTCSIYTEKIWYLEFPLSIEKHNVWHFQFSWSNYKFLFTKFTKSGHLL